METWVALVRFLTLWISKEEKLASIIYTAIRGFRDEEGRNGNVPSGGDSWSTGIESTFVAPDFLHLETVLTLWLSFFNSQLFKIPENEYQLPTCRNKWITGL